MQKERVTVYLSPAQVLDLDLVATWRRVSRSAVVAQLVEEAARVVAAEMDGWAQKVLAGVADHLDLDALQGVENA